MPGAELRTLLPGLLALRLAALTVGDLTEEGGDIGGDAGNPSGSEGAAPPHEHPSPSPTERDYMY